MVIKDVRLDRKTVVRILEREYSNDYLLKHCCCCKKEITSIHYIMTSTKDATILAAFLVLTDRHPWLCIMCFNCVKELELDPIVFKFKYKTGLL